MRYALLLCLCLPAPANVWADRAWFDRLARFEREYQTFLLELLACDGDIVTRETCRGYQRGHLNVGQWERVRAAAKGLFDL